MDITSKKQFIKTKSIFEWKNLKLNLKDSMRFLTISF